jgi:hypothetical protein
VLVVYFAHTRRPPVAADHAPLDRVFHRQRLASSEVAFNVRSLCQQNALPTKHAASSRIPTAYRHARRRPQDQGKFK